jgi:predicted metal-binding membrane protein
MTGMAMPGRSALSITWMRMPGQTWPGAAASFLAAWVVMMVAMMLPALVPVLERYAGIAGTLPRPRPAGLTAVAGAGYFAVWAVVGAAAYPLGVTLTVGALRWPPVARAAPLATAAVLVLAGALQFTRWKLFHLRCCRDCRPSAPPSPAGAWRYGLAVGGHCVLCCAGYMSALLALGMMNLGTVALVASAISLERLAPWPERVVRVAGVVLVGTGAWTVLRIMAR